MADFILGEKRKFDVVEGGEEPASASETPEKASDLQQSLDNARSSRFSSRGAKRRQRLNATGCCQDCDEMLKTSLGPHAYRNRDRYFRKLDVASLEEWAKKCSICSLLLSILRGTDGIILDQSKAYNDPTFNPISTYDENGVTDIDEFLSPNRRVYVALTARRGLRSTKESNLGISSCLALDFHISYRTQVQRSKADVSVKETLTVFELSGIVPSLVGALCPLTNGKTSVQAPASLLWGSLPTLGWDQTRN